VKCTSAGAVLLTTTMLMAFPAEPGLPSFAASSSSCSWRKPLGEWNRFLLLLYYTHLTASCRTTRVSRYQKVGTILDFNEAVDDGVAVASAGPYANHLHPTPDRQPHQHIITQFFTAGCSLHRPINSIKALKETWSLASLFLHLTTDSAWWKEAALMPVLYSLSTYVNDCCKCC